MLAPPAPSLEPLTALVDTLKRAWRAGDVPDAARAIRECPDLLQHRSLVVDLVYEEYCVREEAGDVPNSDEFCHRFPVHQSHIRDVIRGHRLLADHPGLIEPPAAWPRPGESFEQMTIVQELGRGAFARVYLASDPETGGRPVVVKLAPARSGEARTLGGISHESIVAVLWARQAGGFFAVCMPYVGAVTLRDGVEAWFQSKSRSARTLLNVIAAPGLPQVASPAVPLLTGRESHSDAVAAIASRLAGAVAYLHRRGITHGDLKPSNILLGPGASPYLIDFNLSTDHTGSLLRRGGTLPYMPPEQLRLLLGEREEGTAMAGDVYSFGAVLFEAMTGRVPFEPGEFSEPAQMAAELLRLQSVARTTPTAGKGIPRSLARLIDRCLDPNPFARPPIDGVKQTLDWYCNRDRRRRISVAGIGVVALSVAGWLAAPDARPMPEQSPSSAVQPPLDAPPQTADQFFARGQRFLKAKDIPPAMSDFGTAYQKQPDGRNCAYRAYAIALSGQHLPAADVYKDAILKHGYGPAWVHNNRSYSLIQSGGQDRFREAVIEANAALALAPDLRAARLNRADAKFRLSLGNPKATPDSAEVLADIEAIMREPQDSVVLFVQAAMITVKFGGGSEECHARAVSYLREAIRLGRGPDSFKSSPPLRPLVDRADFKELCQLTKGTTPVTPSNPYLVCPPID